MPLREHITFICVDKGDTFPRQLRVKCIFDCGPYKIKVQRAWENVELMHSGSFYAAR